MSWLVYILRCRHGVLYTGITNDLYKRLADHNAGKGAMFTRKNKPCSLVWHEHCLNRSIAQKREHEIKSWRREKKLALIKQSSSPCSECSTL